MIQAPYNFVPINKEVFIPEWGDLVSHDIPFEDGESGVIEVTLKNLTPLHVSNGHTRDAKETSSCYVDSDGHRRYFLPATSLKGMYRSVAEILSFSRFSQYDDDSFGYRTFSKDKVTNKVYASEMKDSLSGYIKVEGDKGVIYPCGKPQKILETELKKTEIQEGQVIVKTGPMEGKKHVYLFSSKSGRSLEIPENVLKNFYSIYKPSKFYAETVEEIKKGFEVPVFYHADENGQVKHFGLSYNYRLPFMNGKHAAHISDFVRQNKVEGYDMTQLLFGYIGKENSLKGRVQIGNAFCETYDLPLEKIRGAVLGQPQASFYPLYLQQESGSQYKTYNNSDSQIAGRKVYRIQSTASIQPAEVDNEKVKSDFDIVPANQEFKFKISVHNLKPEELGLLLSAITLHNNKGVYHNIGKARSFGYGKLELVDISLKGFVSDDVEKYLKKFELCMSIFTRENHMLRWALTPPVQQFMKILSNHKDDIKFMSLEDYTKAKGEKDPNFTGLNESNIEINSYVSSDDISSALKELEDKRNELETQRQKLLEEEVLRARQAEETKQKALVEAAEAELKAKREKEAAAGLSFLDSVKVWDQKRIDGFLKKQKIDKLPAQHVDALIAFILRTTKPADRQKEAFKKKLAQWLSDADLAHVIEQITK